MIDKTLRWRMAVSLVLLVSTLAGCGPSGDSPSVPATSDARLLKLAYVEWTSCVAATNVVKSALEQQGLPVATVSLSGAAMYSALARGDADATVCAWLPSTHASYYARTHNNLTNLGPNMTGTRIGLVVPDYVSIDAIDQLAAHAGQFGHRIVGIDPDAGEMGIARKAIETYKLPFTLVDGSGAGMTAALGSAIADRQWIVVTGWTPHWMWARWKLKYLADPKGSFGGVEDIDTLARKGLQRDMPKAYALLDGFRWTAAEMQQVMAADQQPGDPIEDRAGAWVKSHPDRVSRWAAGQR